MKLEKIFMDKLSRRNNLSHVELMRAINNLPDRLGDAYHSIEMIDVIDHIARRYKLIQKKDGNWLDWFMM